MKTMTDTAEKMHRIPNHRPLASLLLALLIFLMGQPLQALSFFSSDAPEACFPAETTDAKTKDKESVKDLLARTAPAVLSLQIFELRGGRNIYLRSVSAFLISGNGLVLSAADGLSDALDHDGKLRRDRVIRAFLYGEKKFREVRLVRYSRSGDIVLLRLQNVSQRLPYLRIGFIPDPELGEEILCVAPSMDGAESGGLAVGLISEVGRSWRSEHNIPVQNIRCTALFPVSYSGAPIFNAEGRLIGIATLNSERKYSDSSAYFHPLKVVKEALRQTELQARPKLSLGLCFLNDRSAASSCSLYDLPAGLWITSVAQDSPAYVGKLKVGDIILDANGESIKSTGSFSRILEGLSFGQELILGVYRRESGKREEITLYPERYFRNLY